MQKYICEQCGIFITEEKAYLIKSRLSKILSETGAKNFINLYNLLCNHDRNKEMSQKVIDAITTKETQWFRDKTPWDILENTLIPAYIEEIREGKRSKVKIWSAACATGQEPYSTVMCIDNYLNQHKIYDINLSHFEILATDISQAALQTAHIGKYDNISISRGLDNHYRAKYFKQDERTWVLDEIIRKRVQLRQFNLRNSFLSLGQFDIILLRYVAIYFCEEFKREVFRKMAMVLNQHGVIFLGNSELFPEYIEGLELKHCNEGKYYVKRCSI